MTRLMFACDVEPTFDTRQLIRDLRGEGVEWFKFERHQLHPGMPRTIGLVREIGGHVMLDLKLYATGDTARARVLEARGAGAEMVTVHSDCLPHLCGEFRDQLGDLRVIGVRGLTDGTGHDGRSGFCSAALADGIVCSAEWAARIRKNTDKALVCPGGRWNGQEPDGHLHVSSPGAAVAAGVDYYVVGRPIYEAPDPVRAARRIVRELAGERG